MTTSASASHLWKVVFVFSGGEFFKNIRADSPEDAAFEATKLTFEDFKTLRNVFLVNVYQLSS